MGAEILDAYVNVPTIECYDPEFLKGFIRQIQYYSNARLFEDPNHALVLLDDVKQMTDHIMAQINIGRKFKHRDEPENVGNTYDVYLNDTINADNTFYYSSDEIEGIYLSHNLMNYLHTTAPSYVSETKSILEKQIANSSMISKANEKQRNALFDKLYKNIESAFNKPGSFYGKKPKEFKSLVHDMGMEWRSHHVVGSPMKPPPNFKIPNGPDGKPMSFPKMMTLKDNSQELVDLVAEAGIPYIVCSSIGIETGDEIKASAEILQTAGEQAKKAGKSIY